MRKKSMSGSAKSKGKPKDSSKTFDPVKRPGAATAKAKAEGLSVQEWAQKHKGDKGLTGEQARFIVNSKGWNRGKKK